MRAAARKHALIEAGEGVEVTGFVAVETAVETADVGAYDVPQVFAVKITLAVFSAGAKALACQGSDLLNLTAPKTVGAIVVGAAPIHTEGRTGAVGVDGTGGGAPLRRGHGALSGAERFQTSMAQALEGFAGAVALHTGDFHYGLLPCNRIPRDGRSRRTARLTNVVAFAGRDAQKQAQVYDYRLAKQEQALLRKTKARLVSRVDVHIDLALLLVAGVCGKGTELRSG